MGISYVPISDTTIMTNALNSASAWSVSRRLGFPWQQRNVGNTDRLSPSTCIEQSEVIGTRLQGPLTPIGSVLYSLGHFGLPDVVLSLSRKSLKVASLSTISEFCQTDDKGRSSPTARRVKRKHTYGNRRDFAEAASR